MNNARYMISGNLALAPQADVTFQVVAGKKSVTHIAHNRQMAAPDVYAARASRPATLRSVIAAASCAVAVAVLAVVLCGDIVFPAKNPVTPVDVSRVEETVRPGDSLWTLAEEHPVKGMSTSETADLIRSWNGLENATLQPGTALFVPAAPARMVS